MTERLLSLLSRTEFWVVGLGLAAFLVLYWALRGAPIGQAAEEESDAEAPATGYRDRVIAAIVVGLLLVLAGAVIALTRSVAWSLPAFAVGFGIVLTLIAVNQRYRHASPVLRRTIELSNMMLTATLLAGVLIVVNVLAYRYGGRALDFTRERSFSLSSLTRNQLASLERPVTFTVLLGEGPLARAERSRVTELLDLYKAANPRRVRVEYINPYLEIEKVEALTKRLPDIPIPQDGGILIEYGTGEEARHALVRNNDLFEMGRPNRFVQFETTFRGEDAVTSALIGLREDKKPKIVFTTGHGEPSGNDVEIRRPGLGVWKRQLGAMGAEVVEANLLGQEVPPETALLVIVAPKSPFRPDELAQVRAYMERGGPVLALIGAAEKSGLDDLLRSYNLAIGPGVLIDPRLQLRGSPGLVYVFIQGQVRHPIIDPMINRFVLMPNAAPLRLLGGASGAPVNPHVLATPLLRSSPNSWAETDPKTVQRDPDQDELGPLTLGAAVSDRPEPGDSREGRPRLVVFSSGAMADNLIVQQEPTNLDLLMNAVGWLRRRAELKGIAPKTHVALTLVADPVLRNRLILVPTVMALLLIIGLGVTTYAARRE